MSGPIDFLKEMHRIYNDDISPVLDSEEVLKTSLLNLKRHYDDSNQSTRDRANYLADSYYLLLVYRANQAARMNPALKTMPRVISVGRGVIKALVENFYYQLADLTSGRHDESFQHFARLAKDQYKREYHRYSDPPVELWTAMTHVFDHHGV